MLTSVKCTLRYLQYGFFNVKNIHIILININMLRNVIYFTLDWQIWKPSVLLHATTHPRKQTSSGMWSYSVCIFCDLLSATCQSCHQSQWKCLIKSFFQIHSILRILICLLASLCDCSLDMDNMFSLEHTAWTSVQFKFKTICLSYKQ